MTAAGRAAQRARSLALVAALLAGGAATDGAARAAADGGAGAATARATLPSASEATAGGDPVARACDPEVLARARLTRHDQAAAMLTEIDRRAQVALAEERRLAAVSTVGAERARLAIVAGAIALGALLVLVGARRRRKPTLLAGLVLLAGAALGRGPLDAALHLDDRGARTTIDLVRCQLLLAEARASVQQTQLGACVGELAEVDEDLLPIESQLRARQAAELSAVSHLRAEVQAATRAAPDTR